MKGFAKACTAAIAFGLVVAPLTACGGGGGGGGGGPVVSPPPSPPPPPAPPPSPPPPPPPALGTSTSGGAVSSSGAFSGVFRGPAALATPDTLSATVQGRTTAGAPDDISITFGSIIVSADGQTVTFEPDVNEDVAETLFYGLVETRTTTLTDQSGNTYSATLVEFGDEVESGVPFAGSGLPGALTAGTAFYQVDDPDGAPSFLGVISFGSDAVPIAARGGVAQFAVSTFGYYYLPDGRIDRYYGEGVVYVNFNTGVITGEIPGIDFIHDGDDPGVVSIFASNGADLAFTIDARLVDGDIEGFILASPSVGGPLEGDFYAAGDGSHLEIGATYSLAPNGGLVVGAIQGVLAGGAGLAPGSASAGGGVLENPVLGRYFLHQFTGPFAFAAAEDEDELLLGVGPKTGIVGQDVYYLSFDRPSEALQEPTIRVVIGGQSHLYRFEDAVTRHYGPLVTEKFAASEEAGVLGGAGLLSFDLGGRSSAYSMLLFSLLAPVDADFPFFAAFMPLGADAGLIMPASGSASYDAGVFGVYFGDETPRTFQGTGTISVDFSSGTLTGSVPDVDFVDPFFSGEETTNGVDFGLDIDATVVGDDFAGAITATGADMTGFIEGDFYGPTGGSPAEIGAAFGLAGEDGAAFGGLLGIDDQGP